MQKNRWIVLLLVLCLMLTACQFVSAPVESTPETQPSTQQSTPPESNPTEPTGAVTEPVASLPPMSELVIFIYSKDMDYSKILPHANLSSCQEGHLYYYYSWWCKLAVICDEPVRLQCNDADSFYFVKESEPSKLYRVPLDLSQETVIYESDLDSINSIYIESWDMNTKEAITLTEGNKRLALLDVATAELILVFDKAYYINRGSFEGIVEVDEKPYCDLIWFWGQPKEGDRYYTWFYWVETGTFTLMEDG